MALIKSLAAANAGLPDNWTGTTRSTVAHVRDFEGLYHECLAKETRYWGARRVENLVSSSDFGTGWTIDGTRTTGITDPDSGSTAFTLTATAANQQFYCSYSSGGSRTHTFSLWIRRRTGTGTIQLQCSGATLTDVTSAITGSWQRISITQGPLTQATTYFNIKIVTSGDEIDVWHPLGEFVTGQTNQHPGDYGSAGVPTDISFWPSPTFDADEFITLVDGGGNTAEITGGELVLTTAAADYTSTLGEFELPMTINNGDLVRVVGDWTSTISGRIHFDMLTASAYQLQTHSPTGTSGSVDHTFTSTATSTSLKIRLRNAGHATGNTTTFDNVYVYVSRHGSGIDSVKYFAYENGNTVTSNVVNEAQGTAITGISILLEPLKQNKLSHWDMTATLGWTPQGLTSIAAYTGDSPVKGQTAYTLTETSANESHYAQGRPNSTGFTSGVTYTVSALVKAGTRDDVALYFNVDCFPSADRSAHFDLTAGTTSYSGTGTATIEATGFDGWYLITFTQTADATNTGYACVLAMSDGSSISYLGNGSTVHYCTPQVEEGEVATTPIEVTGTANQQRNADTAPYASLTTPQSAGTVVIEFAKAYPQTSTGAQGIVTFDDVTNSGPLIRSASSDDIIADDDTTTATDTLTGDITAFAARWDATASGEMQVGFRTGASTWAWGTASATYDGGFASDNNVYLLQSLAEAANVSDFNAYDDAKTTSWIESNYPPAAGGGDILPFVHHYKLLMR